MPRKKVITEEVSDKKVLTETSDEGSFLAVEDPVTAEIRTEDVCGGRTYRGRRGSGRQRAPCEAGIL